MAETENIKEAEITNQTETKTAEIETSKDTIITNTIPENKAEGLDMGKEIKGGVITEPIKKNKGGNPNWIKGVSANPKGRPKGKIFSLKDDILKSLKRIKKKKPEMYQEIIDSYWTDPKRREFLLEIIDGKARQSIEMSGTMENPVRVIEVKQMEEPKIEANNGV